MAYVNCLEYRAETKQHPWYAWSEPGHLSKCKLPSLAMARVILLTKGHFQFVKQMNAKGSIFIIAAGNADKEQTDPFCHISSR